MKKYNIQVSGESGYDFEVELTKDELHGVLKVLSKCNDLGDYNDSFIVVDIEEDKELLTWM